MKIILSLISKLNLFFLLSIASTTSLLANHGNLPHLIVQQVANAGSAPTSVPSLSGTMLIILSALLFVVALRISKQKTEKVNKFFMTFVGIVILSTVTSGIKLISNAQAGNSFIFQEVVIDPLTSGNEVTIDLLTNQFQSIRNNTGADLRILRFETPANTSCEFLGTNNPCAGDLPKTIPDGAVCEVDCSTTVPPQPI